MRIRRSIATSASRTPLLVGLTCTCSGLKHLWHAGDRLLKNGGFGGVKDFLGYSQITLVHYVYVHVLSIPSIIENTYTNSLNLVFARRAHI